MTGASDWRNWALLASLGVIWGGAFTTTSVAVQDLPPLTIAASRLLVGAIVLVPLAYAFGDGLPRDRAVWGSAVGAALAANAIPFVLLSWAQNHVSSGLAGVFMASLPLIVLPMAHFLIPGEGMSWRKTIGFLVGFAGVVVLIGPSVLFELGGDSTHVLAQLACLGAATGYAVGSIIAKRMPPCHPVSYGAATMLLAALMMAPTTLLLEQPFALDWTLSGALAVTWLGLVPTGLAMVLLVIVVQRTGPTFLSLVNYQVPIWALIFGVVLLGETVHGRAPIALLLILLGVALSQGLLNRLVRKAPEPSL
ncbi:MAG: DMT family transporter [Pseudomonadota bacterium]